MSEEQNNIAHEVAQTPGELLRQERERQGLAQQRIADDLHLSTQMIEAIENNQFSTLGAPVFARGHLRKYAALLSLPVERVHALYQTLNDRPRIVDPVPVMHRSSEPSIPMSPDSQQRRAANHPTRRLVILASLLLIIVAVALAYWWREHSHTAIDAAPSVTSKVIVVAPVSAANAAVVRSEDSSERSEAGHSAELRTSSGTNVSSGAATTRLSTSGVSAANRNKLSLRFEFNDESWIEVYDAHGKRLLYDAGQAKQSRSVEAEPPVKIVLGTAAVVATEVNGHAVVIPARRVNNSVARFTVTSDGAIE